MMEEQPFLVGYLMIKSQTGYTLRISKKQKFVQLYSASRNGIQRLEIRDTETDKGAKIVTLENCVKIVLDQHSSNVIHIVTKTGQVQLQSLQEDVIKQWKTALQTVAFNENPSHIKNVPFINMIEQDNDLYSCSESSFTVSVIPTDASLKCNIDPVLYVLTLSESEIVLKRSNAQNTPVAKWPYRFIRKYGYRENKFTFEAGRKCDTGEGTFKLESKNPQEIFRCLSAKMKSMKKNSLTNIPIIKSDPAFYRMSSTIPTENDSNEFSKIFSSSSSMEPSKPNHFLKNSIAIESFLSPNTNNSSSLQPNPYKPPRKGRCYNNTFLLSESNENKVKNISSVFIQIPNTVETGVSKQTYQIQDYEYIEGITDAWKKLGVDNVKHTENLDKKNQFISCESVHLNNQILQYSINTQEHEYDQLNFFRSAVNNEQNYKISINLETSFRNNQGKIADDYETIGIPTNHCSKEKEHVSAAL